MAFRLSPFAVAAHIGPSVARVRVRSYDVVVPRLAGMSDLPLRPLSEHLEPEARVDQDRDSSDWGHGGYLAGSAQMRGSKVSLWKAASSVPSSQGHMSLHSGGPMAAIILLISPCGLSSHHPSA